MTLYNIPLGSSFLKTLADGIIERFSDDPIRMGQSVVLLPTRRGCISLKDILQKKAKERSLILPRIYALADLEQNPILPGLPIIEIPKTISKWERLGKLAHLVQQFLRQRNLCDSIAVAYKLAKELSVLLDECYISNISLKNIETLFQSDFSIYWQQNLSFLQIISDFWPVILKERGLVETVVQHQHNLRYICSQWSPSFPVILAGTTGTRPATAELAKKVLQFPQGMVVLPGYDVAINGKAIPATHPHYTLSHFVTYLEAGDSIEWYPNRTQEARAKSKFLVEAMAPILSHNTILTQVERQIIEKDVTPIDCDSGDEEAMIIAALLRQTYEVQDKTAVVITPDQGLTKKIQSYLRRWEIEVNISSGTPLGDTVVGTFLTLVSCLSIDMKVIDWLSLLKHPLFLKNEDRHMHLQKVRQLELEVYRKRRIDNITNLDLLPKELRCWYQALLEKVHPLLYKKPKQSFLDYLRLHQQVAESIAGKFLWLNDDGEVAKVFVEDLLSQVETFPSLTWGDYKGLFHQLMQVESVHNKKGIGSPLRILGTLEARQVEADVVILASLNEGSWPQTIEDGPWLSNNMRVKLGLPDLNRRLGLAAHDFCLSFAASRVFLTRSKQNQGVVTTPSRMWQRFHTVAKINGLFFQPMTHLKKLVKDLDTPHSISPSEPPRPQPVRYMKPDQLSVTDIERLMRDPYSVYARKILRLKKLESLDQTLSGREWGQLVHLCLERAFTAYNQVSSINFMETLIQVGKTVFSPYFEDIVVRIFWWNRYLQICKWVQRIISSSFDNLEGLKTEVMGTLELKVGEELLTLKTIADRIDSWGNGHYHIIDYKTGVLPTIKDVEAAFSPQLILEGLILMDGGFQGLQASTIESFYWGLKGGAEGGVIKKIDNYVQLLEEAKRGLLALLDYFYKDEAVYLSCPWGEDKATFKHYFHLARVEEWL